MTDRILSNRSSGGAIDFYTNVAGTPTQQGVVSNAGVWTLGPATPVTTPHQINGVLSFGNTNASFTYTVGATVTIANNTDASGFIYNRSITTASTPRASLMMNTPGNFVSIGTDNASNMVFGVSASGTLGLISSTYGLMSQAGIWTFGGQALSATVGHKISVGAISGAFDSSSGTVQFAATSNSGAPMIILQSNNAASASGPVIVGVVGDGNTPGAGLLFDCRTPTGANFSTRGTNQTAFQWNSGNTVIVGYVTHAGSWNMGNQTSGNGHSFFLTGGGAASFFDLTTTTALSTGNTSGLRVGINGVGGFGYFQTSKNTAVSASHIGLMALIETSGNLNYLWSNAGTWYTSTTFANTGGTGGAVVGSQTSDVRLKQNIAQLSYGLSDVMKLKPVSFQFKNKPEQNRVGFIAQDAQGIIPEVVFDTMEDDHRLGMHYADLTAVLVKAVQELSAKNDELEGSKVQLEDRLATLEARLNNAGF